MATGACATISQELRALALHRLLGALPLRDVAGHGLEARDALALHHELHLLADPVVVALARQAGNSQYVFGIRWLTWSP